MSLKFCEGFVINEDDFTTGWKAWSLSVFVQESDAMMAHYVTDTRRYIHRRRQVYCT